MQICDSCRYFQLCSPLGSLYCDGALRTKGFTGEGVRGPSVIAIKSHTVNPLFTRMKKLPKRISTNTPVFGAALVLIRNPRNAIIAEWHRERTKRQTNRNISNHVLFVGKEYFGKVHIVSPPPNALLTQMPPTQNAPSPKNASTTQPVSKKTCNVLPVPRTSVWHGTIRR